MTCPGQSSPVPQSTVIGDHEGSTPLVVLCSKGRLDFAKAVLARAGACRAVLHPDLEYTSNPLFVSVGHTDVVEWLFETAAAAGCPYDLEATNGPDDGPTLLHVAASFGFLETCKLLARCGASLQRRDSAGATVGHAVLASAEYNEALLDWLAPRSDVDLWAVDDDGNALEAYLRLDTNLFDGNRVDRLFAHRVARAWAVIEAITAVASVPPVAPASRRKERR